MHEYSVVQALLAQVERAAQASSATSVRAVHVVIGELAGVDCELLRTAYGVLREQTPCARAELLIRSQPVTWQCPRCARFFAEGAALRCGACQVPAFLARGDELLLESIELEVSDV